MWPILQPSCPILCSHGNSIMIKNVTLTVFNCKASLFMPETLTNFSVGVSQAIFFASFDILSIVLHSISRYCNAMSTGSCFSNSEKFRQRFSIYFIYTTLRLGRGLRFMITVKVLVRISIIVKRIRILPGHNA